MSDVDSGWLRLPWLGLLIALPLLGCDETRERAKVDDATAAPGKSTRLQCRLSKLAPGWERAKSPMPDHLLEAHVKNDGGALTSLLVEEHPSQSMPGAVASEQRRTETTWSAQPDFGLVRRTPINADGHQGELLVYRWRMARDQPPWIHYRALFPFEEKIVLAMVSDEEELPASGRGRREAAIVAMLEGLDCQAQ